MIQVKETRRKRRYSVLCIPADHEAAHPALNREASDAKIVYNKSNSRIFLYLKLPSFALL